MTEVRLRTIDDATYRYLLNLKQQYKTKGIQKSINQICKEILQKHMKEEVLSDELSQVNALMLEVKELKKLVAEYHESNLALIETILESEGS